MILLDHSLYKENIPLMILCLYLIHTRKKPVESVFQGIIIGLYLFIPIYTALYLYGFNIFTMLEHSWRTWTTPVQYCSFMILAYELTYNKTRDTPFSVTLSFHMASATGYLYEFPRYLSLQGWGWIIRFNKFSVFRLTYSIISLAIIVVLLSERTARLNKHVMLSLFAYCVFTAWYYNNFQWVQSLRCVYVWAGPIKTPWINLFRLPTMLFLLSLTQTLNINTVNNYTNRDCLHDK